MFILSSQLCVPAYGHLRYYRAEDVVKQPLYLNVYHLRMVLTFGEAGWIIVDIAEGDIDGGGPGQPSQLAPHVLGLD